MTTVEKVAWRRDGDGLLACDLDLHAVAREPAPSRAFVVSVSLGTDRHPFDRLVNWVRTWADSRHGEIELHIQSGFTTVDGDGLDVADFLAHDRLVDLFERSDVVIVQGGPGGIKDAREQGRMPIVVPRRSDLGEHVDDHQVIFARAMEQAGVVRVCESEQALHDLLDAVRQGDEDLSVEVSDRNTNDVSARVARATAGEPLRGKTLRRRLLFSLRRAGDHSFTS